MLIASFSKSFVLYNIGYRGSISATSCLRNLLISTTPYSTANKSNVKNEQFLQHPCIQNQTLLSSYDYLIDYFKNNIVYEDEMIVAVNKLPGTPVYRTQEDAKKNTTIDLRRDASAVPLVDTLPDLRHHLAIPHLFVALPVQREHSGIVILAKTREAEKTLRKYQATARAQKLPFHTYLAISCALSALRDHPPASMVFRQKRIGDHLLPDIVDFKSKKLQETGTQLVVHVARSTVSWNHHSKAILSSITVNQDKDGWGCIETFMANKLCPVLGDYLHSRCARVVLGMPVLVDPANVDDSQRVMSSDLLKALQLERKHLPLIPVFLHRHQVLLKLSKKSALVIKAPPTQTFSWALKYLGLWLTNPLSVGTD